MKFWSIIMLFAFLNFTALPSIAAVFGWKTMITNVIINEEDPHSHSTSFIVCEKALPKTLNVFDYVKFAELDLTRQTFVLIDDHFHLSPLIALFSPPPEA